MTNCEHMQVSNTWDSDYKRFKNIASNSFDKLLSVGKINREQLTASKIFNSILRKYTTASDNNGIYVIHITNTYILRNIRYPNRFLF